MVLSSWRIDLLLGVAGLRALRRWILARSWRASWQLSGRCWREDLAAGGSWILVKVGSKLVFQWSWFCPHGRLNVFLGVAGLSVLLCVGPWKKVGAVALQGGQLERPSGAGRQLEPSQRLFQISIRMVVVLPSWQIERFAGVAGLSVLFLLVLGGKLERRPFKGCWRDHLVLGGSWNPVRDGSKLA